MEKIISIVSLFTISLIMAYSQPPATQKDIVDKQANEILQKAAAKIKSYTSLELKLSIEEDPKQSNSNKLQGTLLMQGEKYRMTLNDQIIYCNGKLVWFYLPEVKEVQLHKIDTTSGEALNLTKLLTDYNKNYKARFIREEEGNSATLQIIDLYPKKLGQEYSKLRLYLNKASLQITQMDIQFTSGKMSAYKVNAYKPNVAVTAKDFEFDSNANQNVEVIDMR